MATLFCEFDDADDRGTLEGHRQWWSPHLYATVAACPREAEHRYGPSGYLAWHHWADSRRKTHRQAKCDCGLWLLMAPKTGSGAKPS